MIQGHFKLLGDMEVWISGPIEMKKFQLLVDIVLLMGDLLDDGGMRVVVCFVYDHNRLERKRYKIIKYNVGVATIDGKHE